MNVPIPLAVVTVAVVALVPPGASGEIVPLPAAATHVSAIAGATTSGIDGRLRLGASISGTIRASDTGRPVRLTLVTAFRNGKMYATAYGPTYTIRGLPASSTGYVICARMFVDDGDLPTTYDLYAGECFRGVAWDGDPPARATPVSLTAGQHRRGIDITLPRGGAIAGTIWKSAGVPLSNAWVYLADRSNHVFMNGRTTDANGRYEFLRLNASATRYSICVDPRERQGPTGPLGGTGFLPRCYGSGWWSGNTSRYPTTATPVLVRSGRTHRNVDITVRRGGAVSGRLTDLTTGKPIILADVVVFAGSSNRRLGSVSTTGVHGYYAVHGLPADTAARVCVRNLGGRPGLTYPPTCWRHAAWLGGPPPAGTAGVRVTVGSTRAGVDFRLRPILPGAVSGTITEAAGGQPLPDARVVVQRGGTPVEEGTTDALGHYTVPRVPPAPNIVVCVTGPDATSSVPAPATGWAPRCYPDAAWDQAPSVRHVPAGAARMSLPAGGALTGIDVSLPVGASISGTVVDARTGTPLTDGDVSVYDLDGRYVAATGWVSLAGGHYTLTGLNPKPASSSSGYVVCFSDFLPRDYLPACYADVLWDRSPLETAPGS